MTRFRRNHPRIDGPSVLAVLPHGRGRAEVRVRDISVSGALLATEATLPVGAVVDLELKEAGGATDDAEPLSVRARVARLVGPPDAGIAVEFVERRPGDTFRLLDLVDRHGFSRRVPARAGTGTADKPKPAQVATLGDAEPATTVESERLEAALAEAHAATARAEELEARVHALETELAAARRALGALQPHGPPVAEDAGGADRRVHREQRDEAREVTLGPDSVRTAQDFSDRLKRGARLRLTERFRTLQPVSRLDFQLADWLRSADRLSDLDAAAQQLGGTEQLAAAIYRFFERGLVRITR